MNQPSKAEVDLAIRDVLAFGGLPDVVIPARVEGDETEHRYWSTHCRHNRHDDCNATELAPGIPRRPTQCKTCAAPCRCDCHGERFEEGAR